MNGMVCSNVAARINPNNDPTYREAMILEGAPKGINS